MEFTKERRSSLMFGNPIEQFSRMRSQKVSSFSMKNQWDTGSESSSKSTVQARKIPRTLSELSSQRILLVRTSYIDLLSQLLESHWKRLWAKTIIRINIWIYASNLILSKSETPKDLLSQIDLIPSLELCC